VKESAAPDATVAAVAAVAAAPEGRARERPPIRVTVAANKPAPLAAREVDDDTALRAAVEQFRITYNARLARREGGRGGSVTFDGCDMTIAGQLASATCHVPSAGAEGRMWSFRFAKTGTEWTIASVAMDY